MNVRKDLLAAAPEFLAQALGEKSPALSAFVTEDGRVGRQTVHGLEWVGMVSPTEKRSLLALAEPLFGKASSFLARDDDGNVLSGFRDAAKRTQIKVSLVPSRRLGADDFDNALQPELFYFLQSLVRLGENVWIIGDTGCEFELGCALVPDSHTLISKGPNDRPPPFQAAALGDVSLKEALHMRELGGYSTLVYDGELGEHELSLLGQRGGVVITERATSIERALARTGLLQRQDLAQQLPALASVVHLVRSQTYGVQVSQIGEFRRGEQGVDYVAVAARGFLSDARILAIVQPPETMQRLVEAGIDNVVLALSEAAPDDAMNVMGNNVVDAPDFDDDGQGEIDHDDPGWELDTDGSSETLRQSARRSDREGLVEAPGGGGMFRARPVVRPSTRREADDDAVEVGMLTLDPPSRKIMIPEAPSGVTAKRTFAEIMKERHRFPPLSEKGPTLTPPVLDTTEDDDITP